MPFKLNADYRHHIPKQRFKVTNWAAYDASLRQRGSSTVWVTEAAIAAWTAEPRTTRSGQRAYSALAILTALTLRVDSTGLKLCGAGKWLHEKHGTKVGRSWSNTSSR